MTVGPNKDPNSWYLELQLYEPRANSFELAVFDPDGNKLALGGGSSQVQTVGQLVAVHRRLDFGTPATVTLTSTDPDTNLCLVHAFVGVPVPK